MQVWEGDRPDRSDRRRKGKDDDLDAISAARAALHGRRVSIPKSKDGAVESLRVLRVTRQTAVRARRTALQLLRMSIVAAPESCGTRSGTGPGCTHPDLRCVAARNRQGRRPGRGHPDRAEEPGPPHPRVGDEIATLDELIGPLVTALAPQLLDRVGIGIQIAAQLLVTAGDNPDRLRSEASFAMLCGVAPLPASSGKTRRHRLNRGGDRQANSALHLAVINRIRVEEKTQTYMAKKTAEGHTNREIIRCLKRYLAREVFYLLNPPTSALTTTA